MLGEAISCDQVAAASPTAKSSPRASSDPDRGRLAETALRIRVWGLRFKG